ncbi:DUF4236 domain-containing protein [Arthrobacter sp. NPDC080031]|uniref:DUF4236 domain-containing protein n=1 Tax=Arthrobacter sp. NPDC080031 TaxID=3155918 RepID=UPI00344CF309
MAEDTGMGFIYRKRVKLGQNGHVNISKSGASVSERIGPLTLNSRGRATLRILPGLTFRFGKRR